MFQRLARRGTAFVNHDRSFRNVVVNSGWLFSSNVITSIILFVQAVIITRALGTSQYGLLVLITTYVVTIAQLLDSRLWEAVIKFIPQYREAGEIDRAAAALKLFYGVDLLAAGIALVIIELTADLAANIFLKNPEAAHFIRLYALFTLIDFSTETSSALLRVFNRFRWLSYQAIAQSMLKVSGALLVWVVGPTVGNVLVMMLVTSLLGVFIMQVMAYRVMREVGLQHWPKARLSLLRGEWRQLVGFVGYSNLVATCRLIATRIDILVLGWATSPAEIGVYELAKRLITQVSTLFSPIYTSVYPEISNMIAQRRFTEVKALQARLSKSLIIIVIPLGFATVVAAPLVVPFVFGADFIPAIPLTQLLIGSLIAVPLIWLPGYLLSIGQIRLETLLVLMDTIVYVALLFIGVSVAGSIGAAVATSLHFIVWTGMGLIILLYLHRSQFQKATAIT